MRKNDTSLGGKGCQMDVDADLCRDTRESWRLEDCAGVCFLQVTVVSNRLGWQIETGLERASR